MTYTIQTVVDQKRGCGWRKAGGLYLMGPSESGFCDRLPFPVTDCPCCGQGIKQSRGWTWISPAKLFSFSDLPACEGACEACPLGKLGTMDAEAIFGEKSGLLWVGDQFYTPDTFAKEAIAQGISKRIGAVPRDFVVGQTWVFIAHPKACHTPPAFGESLTFLPGVFMYFRPTRIEYVVKGTESEAELESLYERGLTLVKVVRDAAQDTFV